MVAALSADGQYQVTEFARRCGSAIPARLAKEAEIPWLSRLAVIPSLPRFPITTRRSPGCRAPAFLLRWQRRTGRCKSPDGRKGSDGRSARLPGDRWARMI